MINLFQFKVKVSITPFILYRQDCHCWNKKDDISHNSQGIWICNSFNVTHTWSKIFAGWEKELCSLKTIHKQNKSATRMGKSKRTYNFHNSNWSQLSIWCWILSINVHKISSGRSQSAVNFYRHSIQIYEHTFQCEKQLQFTATEWKKQTLGIERPLFGNETWLPRLQLESDKNCCTWWLLTPS